MSPLKLMSMTDASGIEKSVAHKKGSHGFFDETVV